MRRTAAALSLLVLLTLCSACINGDIDSAPFMEARYQDRFNANRENIIDRCRREVMDAALARADSFLLNRARLMRRVEGRPPKPRRPGDPPLRELSSPLPLRPLFPFEIRFDTLLRDSLYRDSIYRDSLRRLEIDDL